MAILWVIFDVRKSTTSIISPWNLHPSTSWRKARGTRWAMKRTLIVSGDVGDYTIPNFVESIFFSWLKWWWFQPPVVHHIVKIGSSSAKNGWTNKIVPIGSMYGICTYIYHKNPMGLKQPPLVMYITPSTQKKQETQDIQSYNVSEDRLVWLWTPKTHTSPKASETLPVTQDLCCFCWFSDPFYLGYISLTPAAGCPLKQRPSIKWKFQEARILQRWAVLVVKKISSQSSDQLHPDW